ncbi:MAG: FecR domain-containing protein [Myxococcota bacterium]
MICAVAACDRSLPQERVSPAELASEPLNSPPLANEPVAVVKDVRGQVWSAGKLLAIGDVIGLNEAIDARDGRAVLEILEMGEVRIFANTRMRLASKWSLRLLIGKVWCFIGGAMSSQFAVETENAVAGVRGTEFLVSTENEVTEVSVITGTVEVANRQHPAKPLPVSRGHRTRVVADIQPQEVSEFLPTTAAEDWQSLERSLQRLPGDEGTQNGRDDANEPPKREGEGTKQRLKEEGNNIKQRLQDEAKATRRRLAEQERAMRRELERKEKELRQQIEKNEKDDKDAVKDFLK